ncbi:hypothetical protein SAY87_032134 [Trapa incisa]|uniref:Peptidase M41 domain-containing protein n=1 Tax=Trapa incisa TaxID=236973 RepID=A0AAN7QLK2_9MYRT|nr:hypothetical protein SAY87_032134 [Trapa incisa]
MLCTLRPIILSSRFRSWSFLNDRDISPACIRCSSSDERLGRSLLRMERQLNKGDYKRALSTVKQLQGKPGGLHGFGAAEQVLTPFSLFSIYMPWKILSSGDLFVQALGDSVEKIFLEEGNEDLSQEDLFMFAQHEAGHFLCGYLLGVLPKGYELLKKGISGQHQIAGGNVNFVGFDFLGDIPLNPQTFDNFSCVIVGGLVAEHLSLGYSEGLHSDIDKLDRVIRWTSLREDEAKFHIRWAVTNTSYILHQHKEALQRLAEAMAAGKSIGTCIQVIEHAIH